MNTIAAFLLRVAPFSTLPIADIERLALLAQVVNHRKGATIYNEGEDDSSVFVMQRGRAILFKHNFEGRALAMDMVLPEMLLSPADHIASDVRPYPCTAVACVDLVVIRIPRRYLQSIYARCPAMASSIMDLLTRQLSRTRECAISSQDPVRQRVARILFQLKETNGNTLPFTKREISELAATTVESAIRVLSEFQRKRWLTSERGKIMLKDIAKLQAIYQGPGVGACHSPMQSLQAA